MNLHLYKCDVCGKVIVILSDSGMPTICCGQPMKELIANQTDGATEKHVPVYHIDDNAIQVRVGIKPHPMQNEHSITWIGIQTDYGFQFKTLSPQDLPEACFSIQKGDSVKAVYAFCNLHGLWCSETEKK